MNKVFKSGSGDAQAVMDERSEAMRKSLDNILDHARTSTPSEIMERMRAAGREVPAYRDPDPQPLPDFGGGLKYDHGKPIAGALYQDFPRALKMVAEIATYGANECVRGSWKDVPNAEQRYLDDMHRHLLDANLTELDDESGLPHLAHAAWGALAVLELALGRGALRITPTEAGIKFEPVSFPGDEA